MRVAYAKRERWREGQDKSDAGGGGGAGEGGGECEALKEDGVSEGTSAFDQRHSARVQAAVSFLFFFCAPTVHPIAPHWWFAAQNDGIA